MSDWFCSSVAYAAIPQFAASTAYTVGQFVRQLAALTQPYHSFVFRCTTAGTSAASEPSWTGAPGDGQTVTSGGATFTNVTGKETYGWSAASGSITTFSYGMSFLSRMAPGDRLFLSSDHAESLAIALALNFCGTGAGFVGVRVISVNRAGSVPPVAADLQSGATITVASGFNLIFDNQTPAYFHGFTFSYGGTALYFNNSGTKSCYFKNCAFVLTNASVFRLMGNNPSNVTLDNTTFKFAHSGQMFGSITYAFELTWLDTATPFIGPTLPTTPFSNAGSSLQLTCRGVDFSALTSATLITQAGGGDHVKALFDGCRIASGVTRYNAPTANMCDNAIAEFVNCFDGTSMISERHGTPGVLTVDRSTTLVGGAPDNTGSYSFKLVSSTRVDRLTKTLDTFYLDVENVAVGSSRTATVEIISSASLNTDDVRLVLEYPGTAGSALTTFKDSYVGTVAALPTSTATWNSPPGTPVTQKVSVTFTPQTAGRVRGQVRLGKVSTTIWVNPQLTLS